MKILIIALAFEGGKSGIADYTISVCRELSKEHQLDLLIHRSDEAIFPAANNNIRFRYVSELLKPPAISMLWHMFILPFLLRAKRYDFVFLTAGNRRIMCRFPSNCIVTIHDLAQYYIPDKFNRSRMFYVKHLVRHFIQRAPIIVAISENTKNDLIKHYMLPLNRIVVNYNGYDPERIKVRLSELELRRMFGITGKYLFYHSRIEHPLKNHIHLIRAFELIPEDISSDFELVFSGPDSTGCEEVYKYVTDSPAIKSIKFLGAIDDKYLGALYHYSFLYVFPSLYEGFGIPIVEAMASGTPVLCSGTSSLPEIGGDAVLSFNPLLHADIAKKIMTVISDPGLYAKMRARGLERAENFSWGIHAEILIGIMSNRPQTSNFLKYSEYGEA